MGLGCKPVGKLGGVFRKLDNELERQRKENAKKGKGKNAEVTPEEAATLDKVTEATAKKV